MTTRQKVKFYAGVTLFCLGLFLPLLALVVPFLGFPLLVKVLLSSILVVGGPEVFIVIGVIFAGKPAIDLIKAKFKSLLLFMPVSRTRHYIGISCLLFSIIASWVLMYYFILTEIPINEKVKLLFLGSIDFIFVISFFILGGPFFQKLANLFTWNPSDT